MIEINSCKYFLFITLLGFSITSTALAKDPELRQETFNLEKSHLALHGYDPVSYFDNKPQKGNASLSFEYTGIKYQFSSQENLNKFRTSPNRYEPQFGGWCAYALLEDDLVDVNPERYKIIDDKLYLFYDGFWGNTLKRWNSRANTTSESTLVETANKSWETKQLYNP